MKSNARLENHPVHPMLVTFPIALWITGLIFHFISVSTNAPFWFKVAQYNYFAGVIGALIAAIPGFVDYGTLPLNSTQRQLATRHMLLNLVIVVLFIINVWVMWTTPARLGWRNNSLLILPIVGTLALLYSGWLGASLVHEHGVSISEDAIPEIPASPQAERGFYPGISGAKGGEVKPDEDKGQK